MGLVPVPSPAGTNAIVSHEYTRNQALCHSSMNMAFEMQFDVMAQEPTIRKLGDWIS